MLKKWDYNLERYQCPKCSRTWDYTDNTPRSQNTTKLCPECKPKSKYNKNISCWMPIYLLDIIDLLIKLKLEPSRSSVIRTAVKKHIVETINLIDYSDKFKQDFNKIKEKLEKMVENDKI